MEKTPASSFWTPTSAATDCPDPPSLSPGRLLRPWRLRPRDLYEMAAMGYHLATLPVARLQLRRLRSIPGRGIDAVDSGMTPGQAAMPTPQSD